MGLDVISFDSPQIKGEIDRHKLHFNLAAARNYCVDQSPTEIVILNDADTIPDKPALIAAIEHVINTGESCLPYTRYNIVSHQATQQYIQGTPINPRSCQIYSDSVGAILVTTKKMWSRHNGQDERMFGWGYEDTAWHIAYETLIGEIHRVDGDIYALSHKVAERGINTSLNRDHCDRYLNTKGDIEAMADLVSGNRLRKG